uniref:Uncharacterized protein n=1 Tax=Prevotella sp. GTC17260 TaxID=3236796 RepID=A0AB33J6B4_9BACT
MHHAISTEQGVDDLADFDIGSIVKVFWKALAIELFFYPCLDVGGLEVGIDSRSLKNIKILKILKLCVFNSKN